jgi:hypothetical protein
MPPSPPLLLWPTMLIPKKFTASMFKETVMMFKDMVESVIEENEEVLDIGGIRCLLRLGLRLRCARETLLCSVDVRYGLFFDHAFTK